MHGQFLARLCALAMGALAPATALPIRTPVAAVAANEAGVVAVAAGEVRIMDATGALLGRIAPARPQATQRRNRMNTGGGFSAAAGVTADGDFNDPYDPDSEIEDPENILVEDEPPAPRRRRALARSGDVALAVGGAVAWMGRDDGLWRLPFSGGAERVALPVAGPIRAIAASPDGRVVLAASAGGLAWSDDGGARFELVSDAPAGVRRLAVTASGHAYALAGDDVYLVHDGAAGANALISDADDLVACGDAALALARRRAIPLTDSAAAHGHGDDEPSPVPADVRRLACAPAGDLWIAYGTGLWISEDQGRSWLPRMDAAAAFPIAELAVTRLGLWVAGAGGLMVLPLRPTERAGAGPPNLPRGAGVDMGPIARQRWWLAALPRVDLGFATAQSNRRRDVRAFVLLSFAFEPLRAVRAERQMENERRTAQDRGRVQRALVSIAGSQDVLDPIATEEREATLRLLED